MRLVDLLTPERVLIPLDAPRADGGTESLHSAVMPLLDRLAGRGIVEEAAKLRARVEEERSEDLVALGDRAFVMHYRSDAVVELAAAIGVAPQPLVRKVGDSEPQRARILLLIVSPPRLAASYIQVLGAFVRLLSRPKAVEAILAARTAEELLSLPELQEQLPEEITVRDIMNERPRTTRPDAPLREAARDMVRAGIGALPVVDASGLLVGLLSDKELMRHMLSNSLLPGAHSRRTPPQGVPGVEGRRAVRDVMTRQVLAVSPEQPLAEVASLMTNKDVAHVPVVSEGKLIGFLTRGDIVRKLIGS
ncbi:MAG TPA: CBS domain-containing protein [Gemmatimonadaceae bacterium]|nr:CBS domain-containing protein [Gemmatimonadaceae bacterium]